MIINNVSDGLDVSQLPAEETTKQGAVPVRGRFATLGLRTISSVIIITAVFLGVTAPVAPFVAITSLFIIVGLWEFFDLTAKKGFHAFRWAGICIGAALPWVTWIAATAGEGSWIQESVALWMLVGALVICTIQFVRRASDDALATVATTVFGLLYVGWLFSFLVRLKLLPGGAALVGYVIAVTKLGDMGSYVFGSLFGRTPLIPRISPKKTLEGFMGGMATSIAAAILLQRWLPSTLPVVQLAGLGVLVGGGAHVGDLIESLFKRDCHVKDSGGVIPGLGGLLDVLDSLLFTIPVFYVCVRVIWF
jgi:phosphatidate cytidylyltransferase